MFLEQYFRWIVFAYSSVTNNAIPVIYNSFECFQIFTGLYVKRERVPNFWSKRSYAVITKANLIDFRNVKIKAIFTTNFSLLVTLNDTHRENCVSLDSVQQFIKVEAWQLLTFFLCLHNQLVSIYSIVT